MKTNANSRFSNYPFLLLIWFLGIICIYAVGNYLEFFSIPPSTESLVSWDANFYRSIFLDGYQYVPMEQCNVGFFPFFSFVWWLVGGSPLLISILNFIVFTCSLKYLIGDRANDLLTLLMITIPSMFFFFVPYSEALFFLFGTLILVGLKNNIKWMVFLGLLFGSMTRPSFLFFIPSFCFLFLVELRSKNFLDLLKEYVFFYGFPIVLGITTVLCINYIETGNLFAYFETQHNVWQRQFNFPTLPFGSTEGKALVWVEALAFWIGSMMLVYFTRWSFVHFTKSNPLEKYNKDIIFSVAFLLMSFFSIIFFNPTWVINRTILNGINRYMFVNPFFYLVIYHLATVLKIRPIHYLYLTIFSFLTWLLLEQYYLHIQLALYFASVTLYILTFILYLDRKNLFVFGVLLIINLIGQVYLLDRFLNNLWVG